MGQRWLINHPKLKVFRKTGSEGPSYDPYGYENLEVETPDAKVLLHEGLAIYAEIIKPDGTKVRLDAVGKDYDDRKWGDRILHEHTGYTTKQLERIFNKKQSRCPKGGHHEIEYMNGYPGETFEFCRKCEKTVGSWFDESAVI